MTLLFLDDMKVRHEHFDALAAGHDVWHAWDAAQAMKRLEERVYDVAFLGHDLSDEHYAEYHARQSGTAGGSGKDVARFIASMEPERRPKRVVIHSWNPIGAAAMAAILRDAGVASERVPFGCFSVEAA